jgi:hypothetical protein
MLAKLRGRLTYANVVATLALFLALGGVSYGAISIGSSSIKNNSVRTQDLRNNDIRSKDIRNRTIIGRDMLTNTVTGLQVRENSLAKVPDADKLDGQESATFRDKCPAGTLAHAGACFETTVRAAATLREAARTCGAANRRLPLWTELESLRQEPGISIAIPELTANVSGTGASPRVLTINPDGDLDDDPLTTSSGFRCVAPLTNQ